MPASRIELLNGKYIDDQMANGVPEGGTAGQILAKATDDDYDTEWITGGGGGSGTVTSIATSSPLTGGTITTSGTIGISQAGILSDGYLSSTDWNTFNNKQNAITLTTTGNSGSSTFVSNTLNIPTYTLSGLGGISLTSLSASSPLSYNNLTGAFSIQVANTSQNGYLSSTDWNIFNNKFNLPSLTAGSVLFSNGTTISEDNANFFWDDTNNRLGIGTNTPAGALDVVGQIRATGNVYGLGFYTANASLTNQEVGGGASYFQVYTNIGNRPVYLASNLVNILAVNDFAANNYRGVGIADNGTPLTITNNSSVLLGLDSTSRGFLLPSLTTIQRNAITTPATGLQIYNNTTNKISYYNGSSWIELGSGTGTVTSVGLSMPSAFTVTNSPVITNGTLTVTGAGTTSQLIDGTGALQSIPTSLPPSGTAGGDLSGTYPNPNVDRIHGIDMQAGTPSTNDVWVYGGSPAKWQHQHLNASQVDNDSSVTGATVKDALQHLDTAKVETSRTISTTAPLSGGGDLSANRTLSISQANTSTSGYLSSTDWNTFNGKQAALSGTGLVKSSSGTISYVTDNSTNWDTAYTNRITSLTTTGSSGSATLASNVLNIPTYTLTGLGGGTWATLNYPTWTSGTPFVKMTAAGTFSLDTNTYYLASNPNGYTSNTGTVTSVAALTLGTSGTDLSSTVANGTTTPVITLNVPDASATARGVITTGTQTIAGAKTLSSLASFSAGINVTPPTGSGTTVAGIIVSGSNTNGGVSYVDFLKTTNTAVGATNPNKWFRLNSTGGLEIVNSAYSNTLLILTDAGALTTASTVNGATPTEMGYLSGVTSAIQTQINNKVSTTRLISTTAPLSGGGDLSADRTLSITQATTSTNGYLSSTDWNTFNNKGYAINLGATATSLSANTTYYFGMPSTNINTAANDRRVYIPQTGTIKSCYIYLRTTTVTNGENWTLTLRLNNSSNTTIATVSNSSNQRLYSNNALNISVSQGDYFEITTTTPTTAPASTFIYGTIYIQ